MTQTNHALDISPALFAVQPLPTPTSRTQGSALGMAAETLLISELLERGHKVAVPVIDDDGVDLIVNYTLKIQVKSTAIRNSAGALKVELCRSCYRNAGGEARDRSIKAHVDILAVFARDHREWWFVPRHALRSSKRLSLADSSPTYGAWREAWDVFDPSAPTHMG